MKISTKYFGEITINEEEILTFESGIPGFLDEKQFIIQMLTDDGLYSVLQSVTTPELAFVITDPFFFSKIMIFIWMMRLSNN